MAYAPGVESRGGEYIGAGVASFGQSMGEGIEKYKKRRQEYKGLQQYAAATGDIPKEVSDTMSLDELKGQVAANELNKAKVKEFENEKFAGLQRDAEIGRIAQEKAAATRAEMNRLRDEGFDAEGADLGPESPQERLARMKKHGLSPQSQDLRIDSYLKERGMLPQAAEVAPLPPPGMVAGTQSVRTPSGSVYNFEPPPAAKAPVSNVLNPAVDPSGNPIPGVSFDAKGGLHNLPTPAAGTPGGAAPKRTADEMKNMGFADRVEFSEKEFTELFDNGFDPSGAGGLLSKGPRFTQSANRQRFNDAADNLISAILRRESGAAISQGERVAAEREYIPKVGDKAATIKAKAQRRQILLNGLRQSSGAAAGPEAAVAGVAEAGQGAGTAAAGPVPRKFSTMIEAINNSKVGDVVSVWDPQAGKFREAVVEASQ